MTEILEMLKIKKMRKFTTIPEQSMAMQA